MNAGIGPGKTREDHRQVADQLYSFYAEGRELRRLVAIIGEASLGDEERRYLEFADEFETALVGQGRAGRTIEESLDLAWQLLSAFPAGDLKRIHRDLIAKYLGSLSEPEETADVGAGPSAES